MRAAATALLLQQLVDGAEENTVQRGCGTLNKAKESRLPLLASSPTSHGRARHSRSLGDYETTHSQPTSQPETTKNQMNTKTTQPTHTTNDNQHSSREWPLTRA